MCRYAFKQYKQHFACFECRKTFKIPFEVTRSEGQIVVNHPTSPVCPECKRPMHSMGLDFHAPKQNNIKQWRKIKVLFAAGWAFHSCGCGSGQRPRLLSEVPAFLAQCSSAKTEGQRLLERFSSKVQ